MFMFNYWRKFRHEYMFNLNRVNNICILLLNLFDIIEMVVLHIRWLGHTNGFLFLLGGFVCFWICFGNGFLVTCRGCNFAHAKASFWVAKAVLLCVCGEAYVSGFEHSLTTRVGFTVSCEFARYSTLHYVSSFFHWL